MIAAGHKGKRKGVGVTKVRRLAGTSPYELKASSNRALVDGECYIDPEIGAQK